MIVQFYNFIQGDISTTTFIDFMALTLLLPHLFAIVEWIHIKKMGHAKDGSLYFVVHGNIVLLLYVGIQFFCIQKESLPIVFALASLAKLSYICVALLLKQAKKRENKQEHVEKEELPKFDKLCLQEQCREAERQEGIEQQTSGEQGIQFEHIAKTLENLRRQKLTTGDRLECKKIEEILRLYAAKKQLTTAEIRLLNDILASLLKMMAKYTV